MLTQKFVDICYCQYGIFGYIWHGVCACWGNENQNPKPCCRLHLQHTYT
jgi:hypothetical protein